MTERDKLLKSIDLFPVPIIKDGQMSTIPSAVLPIFHKKFDFLLIQNANRHQILEPEDSGLSNEELTVARYLRKVLLNDPLKTGVKETLTDAFVNYLLTRLGFSEYPFLLNLQEEYRFKVQEKVVTAKIEFTVEKNNGVLCLDEDKHINSITETSEYGECQIAADILACAYSNFETAMSPTRGMNQMIFAIRVIGSRFTFYKALISKEYLQNLPYEFPPDSIKIEILRFPPKEQHPYGYDYADERLRPLIIELFLRLREQIRYM